MKMFDINKAIKESKINKNELNKLEKAISKEFPNDRMMYELHFIRALRSLQNKKIAS